MPGKRGAKGRLGGQEGLTLLEVLVAAAIVAILFSIAVPSYQHYVQRGQRVEAIRSMLQVAACQERLRAADGFYDTGRCLENSDTGNYRLRLEPAAQSGILQYTVIAAPVTTQAGDYCDSLTLNNVGTRGISGDPERTADCWSGK